VRAAYGFGDKPESSTLDVPQTEDDPSLNFLPDSLLGGTRNEIDSLRVFDQQNYVSRRARAYASPSNLTLVLTEDGKVVDRVRSKDFYDGKIDDYVQTAPAQGRLAWLFYQDDPIFQLYSPVRQAFFYGRYLVFIDRDAYVAETGTTVLSFIDLQYNRKSLGTDAPMPIFWTPVVTQDPDAELYIRDGQLYVGEQAVTMPVLNYLSSLLQLYTHLTISAVDPETHGDLESVIPDLQFYFDRAVEIAGEDAAEQAELLAGENLSRTLMEGVQQVLEQSARSPRLSPIPDDNELFRQAANAMGKNLMVQRSLMARVELVWARMALPQPEKMPQLREAIALTAGGVVARNPALLREGMLHAVNHPLVKWGVPVVSAFIYGYYHPEIAGYVYQGLDATRLALGTVFERAGQVAEVFKEAALTTVRGPLSVPQVYFQNGRFPKLCVGLTAAFVTLALTLGIPRLIVNTGYLVRDLRRGVPYEHDDGLAASGWRRRLGNWKAQFIARQENVRQTRAANQAQRAAEHMGSTREYTVDETAYITAVVNDLERRNETWITRCLDKVKTWPIVRRLAGDPSSSAGRQIETFKGALMHFLFSAASFHEFVETVTETGKKIFAATAFVTNPTAYLTTLLYPNYARTILRGVEQAHLPTNINGGLRTVWEENRLRFAGLFGNPMLDSLRLWEAKIVPVEVAIQKEVLRASFKALRRYITDTNELGRLIQVGGVDSVTDDDLYLMTFSQRSFFREYQETLQERAMQIYLARLATEKVNCGGAAEMSAAELKQVTLGCADSLQLGPEDAQTIVAQALRQSDVFGDVMTSRLNWTESYDRFKRAWNHYHTRKLEPARNMPMKQMDIVERQSNDVFATGRATGNLISSWIVDKPIELFFFLFLTANNFKGINVPIHDEMISPDSLFFLGRFPIYTCFMGSILTSILLDIRMKLLQDTMHQEDFGQVPQGEDAKRSYLSWYWKHFWHPKNKLWDNHKFYVKLMTTQMPMTVMMAAITSFFSLGRIDLENIVTMIAAIYVVPLGGLSFKMERAFEMASGFPLKDIEPEFHPHPEVQSFKERAVLKLRLRYSIPSKFVENFLWFVFGNAETLDTEKYGSRSLCRIVGNGHLPTDLAVRFLRRIANAMGAIPGVKKVTDTCAWLLVNNRTDGAGE